MNEALELENIILSTLSFYEPMSFSKIIFDIDSKLLESYPNFDKDQMNEILVALEKKGLVKKSGGGSEAQWIRIHKKRSFWKRLMGLFR